MQRAGALVDVMDALPSALRNRGHDVSVALPFAIRPTLRGIWKAAARAACSCSLYAAMNFLIAQEFMASAASRTKIMPRDLFFSAKRRSSWPGD